MKNRILKLALMLVLPCFSSRATAQVTSLLGTCDVTFEIGNDVTLCASSSFYGLPAGSPAGGTYSGTGVLDNFFLANLAGPGEHIITYTYDNGVCSGTASDTITVVTPIPLILDGDMELCFGESTVITALNGEDLEWESGSNATSETHQPDETTNYSVYGFDVNGCLTAAGYTIIVHPLPLVEITGDTSLCLGETSLLTANGAVDYVWSDASTDETLLAENLADLQYSLTGTDEFGCVNEDITTVTVHDYPDVTATDIVYGCPGEELLLQAFGASTYTWSVGGDLSYVYIDAAVSQSITVVGTNEFGCSDEAVSQVEVYPVPDFEIIGDLEICAGEVTELIATGNYTYIWSNGGLENSIMVSPESTTMYLATAQNEFGCQSMDDAMLIVYDLPEVSISGDTEICAGTSTTLTAGGADDYDWSDGSSDPDITISPLMNTIITVTGTDVHGCTSQATENVIVHQLPIVEIVGDAEVCQGSYGYFSVVGFDNYVWNDFLNGNNSMQLIFENTLVTVQAENDFGCVAFDSFPVEVLSLPELSMSGDLEVCPNEITTLTASGASEYHWFNGVVSESFELMAAETTELLFFQGIGENGCSSMYEFELMVFDQVSSTITAEPLNNLCVGDIVTLDDVEFDNSLWTMPNDVIESDMLIWEISSVNDEISVVSWDENGCQTIAASYVIDALAGPEVNVSGILEICNGESTTLTATGSDNYTWSTEVIGESITVSPDVSTVYSVNSSNGVCVTTVDVEVTVVQIPELTFSGDAQICENDVTVIEVSGAENVVWNGDLEGNTQTLNPTTTTTYSVVGNNAELCFSEINITIQVDSLPVVQITSSADPVCSGEPVTLSGEGAETYSWSNKIIGDEITLNPTEDQEVFVTGTDGNGCVGTDAYMINVFEATALTFDLSDTLCWEDLNLVELTASPIGGVFSGIGVTNGNQLDPNSVNPESMITITYAYTNEFGCISEDEEVAFVYICEGIGELSNIEFEVYPNPVNDILQFRSSVNVESFSILDISGQVITHRNSGMSMTWSENVSNLSAGMYFVEIKTASDVVLRRPFMIE